jgi:plastocyanin
LLAAAAAGAALTLSAGAGEPPPVSQPLQNGDTFTYVFAQPGTYSYLCTIHPCMRGMVVVTAG